MRIAMLAPVAWRTPPRHYGPWEQVAFNISEGLAKRGIDVTLFATKDSFTSGKLDAIIEKGYEEDKTRNAKVLECMHISYVMEKANQFDLIHNHFDFLPLTYSGLVATPMITTIHGFSSPQIIPVYKKYNDINYYVSISDADRHPSLKYIATIYHGIQPDEFVYIEKPQDYLISFGRIHPDKGTDEAIAIAKATGKRLLIAGIIQHPEYFRERVEPFIDEDQIIFLGHAGPEKRKELLGNAIALLHPIHFNEPFGLSVAEAMFCGTPVIAYNRGSMPELIANGVSGFLVNNIEEAANAVNKIGHVSRRKCYEYATAKFSYETMIDKYIEAYKSILNK
ncbi:MAG TPA: glycosyltransferase family 4 protein [Chitinophagaceae bacterium]